MKKEECYILFNQMMGMLFYDLKECPKELKLAKKVAEKINKEYFHTKE